MFSTFRQLQQYLNSLKQSANFSREYLHKIGEGESKHDKNNPQCLYSVPERTVLNCDNIQVLLGSIWIRILFCIILCTRNNLAKYTGQMYHYSTEIKETTMDWPCIQEAAEMLNLSN
jgi:hypothetical protein